MIKLNRALLFSVITVILTLLFIFSVSASDEGQEFVKPKITVENYTVYITDADTVSNIRFVLGEYTTSSDIKNAQGCVSLSNTVIEANTVDGVFEYEMPNGGIYSFWLKTKSGKQYVYSPVDVTVMTPEVSVNGVTVTARNFYGIRDLFIAKGHHTSYPEIKANGYVVSITKNKLAYLKSYSYTLKDEGDYTVYMRFSDGSEWYDHINIDCINPTFSPDGLQLTVGNLEGVKVIRTAYGEYSAISAIKKSDSQRGFTSKGVLKNVDEYTIQYRKEGKITVVVQYENGYYEFFWHNIEKKVSSYSLEDNTVTFGDLEGLNVLRYAKGEYSSAYEIKNANGSKYLKSDSVTDSEVSITLDPGTYTFCVQYHDQSQNIYVIKIPAIYTQNYSFTDSNGKNVHMPYWLYTPYDAKEGMPLILVLHSAHVKYKSELSDEENLTNLVTYEKDDFPKFFYNGEFGEIPAYIVMPQTSSSSLGWASRGKDIAELVGYCEREYGIDTENVSVIGYSLGGTGAVELAAEYPGLFKNVISVAGGLDGVTNNIRPFTGGQRIQLSDTLYPELRVLNANSNGYEKNYMKYLYESNINKLKYLAQSEAEIKAAQDFMYDRLDAVSKSFKNSSSRLWTIVGSLDAEVEYTVHEILCGYIGSGNSKCDVLQDFSHSKTLSACLENKNEIIDFLLKR